jgi:hypothetical protein
MRVYLSQKRVIISAYVMKAYRGVKVQLHSYISSAFDGGEWLDLRPGCFNPGKVPR